jgi:hypothetical protein
MSISETGFINGPYDDLVALIQVTHDEAQRARVLERPNKPPM